MKRRDILKGITLLPVLSGSVGSLLLSESAFAEKGSKKPGKRDFFEELGVTPIINATTTMTFLSGSRMLPEVMEAINSTSHHFANMYDLQDKVGEKIAQMLNCEAAMVTSGAAGAMTIGTAACITGKDPKKIDLLPPNLPGPKREVIIQKSHRYIFDRAILNNGVKMVEVEGPEEMEKAFTENTVMAHFFNAARKSTITHENFVAIAKRHNIPTFIDAAADYPPKENLFRFQKIGFDLITFSGGKMLRGPQSAGLLFGRKDLIEAAKLNDSPHECPIGRPMKVNKEEIFGMYAALKIALETDDEEQLKEWNKRINHISKIVEQVNTVKAARRDNPGPANAFPGMNVTWDQNTVKISPEEVVEKLKKNKPSIVAGGRQNFLNIGVVLLNSDEVDEVAKAVKKILRDAS
ncbi:MAG: aminotransferase class V-fold PLP-dependent enzyme [Ginsengibacter sp.]